MSTFVGPVDQLVREGRLAPPGRPGLLAELDHFEILRLVGAGGMGLVFQARDTTDQKLVAVKLLKPELAVNELARRRFLKEAHHMQRLEHPGILPVLSVSDHPERPYFVLPYLAQGSLARRLQPGKPLAADQVLPIALKIASALQFAHSKGIIHRDLKPANILLDDHGAAYLTDFGLARTLFNDSMVDLDRGHCEGTAPYMSPQSAEGDAEDTRGDIYAFGAVLYEMLTGQPPYDGASPSQALEKIRQGPPPPIRELNPEAPAALVTIAEGAMARSHRDRYANMTDVVADVERVRHGKTPHGPHLDRYPEPAIPQSRRWFPWITGAAAVALLLAFLGLVWPGGLFRVEPTRLQEIRRVQLAGIWNWSDAQLGDWNADAQSDFFLARGNEILVVSSDGQSFAPIMVNGGRPGWALRKLLDIDGDGMDEAFVTWADGTNVALAALGQNGWAAKTLTWPKTTVEHEAFGTLRGNGGPLSVIRTQAGGPRRLYAAEGISWGERAYCCFDLEEEKLLWRVPVAAYPIADHVLIDVDGNGTLDLVAGSDATDNGVSLPDGTSDTNSYIYAVSAEGQLLWRQQRGGAYSKARITSLHDPDSGRQRLYAWTVFHHSGTEVPDHPENTMLVELNPQDGSVRAGYDAGAHVQDCLAADLDRDGQPELIASDHRGFIHVVTADLAPVRRACVMTNQYDTVTLLLLAVTNLTARPELHLVIKANQTEFIRNVNTGNRREGVNLRGDYDNSLLVLNPSLEVVARHLVAKHWQQPRPFAAAVANLDQDPQAEIALFTSDVRVLKLREQ